MSPFLRKVTTIITYTYNCTNCGIIEQKQSITSSVLTLCPFCPDGYLTKVITSANFCLKGEGWAGKEHKANATFIPRSN